MSHYKEKNSFMIREVKGKIKWFDPNKGYGFIKDDNSPEDILLHKNVADEYGMKRLDAGTYLKCEVMDSPKGVMVTRIVNIIQNAQTLSEEILSHPLPAAKSLSEEAALFREKMRALRAEDLTVAIVKWYDDRKGFGFAVSLEHDQDIMLSRRVLRDCGVRAIFPGDKLNVKIEQKDTGLVAEYIEYT